MEDEEVVSVELIGYAAGVWFCACVLAGVQSPLRWLCLGAAGGGGGAPPNGPVTPPTWRWSAMKWRAAHHDTIQVEGTIYSRSAATKMVDLKLIFCP